GNSPRAGGWSKLGCARPALRLLVLLGLLDARHVDELIPLFQVDEPDALGVAADFRNTLHLRADHDPAARDEHDFVFRHDLEGGDHLAVSLGRLDGDDSLSAAAGDAVLADRRTLPVAVLGRDEDARLALHRDHADDRVVLFQRDAAHSVCGPPHRTDIGLL